MTKSFLHFVDWTRRSLNGRPAPGDVRVIDEQLRMIWAHSRIGLLVAMAFAIALALALRGEAASALMVDAWLAVKLAISLFRGWQGWRFLKDPSIGHRSSGATLAALMADAAVWGAAGLYMAMTAPLPLVSFFSAVLACISCVATFGLQVSARFTAAYTAPILAPTAIGLMLRGEGLEQLGGIGLLLLLVLQLSTAMRSERRLTEGIQLRWRAEALAQEKEQALKTSMRQSAVKTQFLANISHELRTPLHGILGMAQLLHLGVKEPAQLRRVELIESTGQHLLDLINDLLDISRIEAGQFAIRSEAFDLAAQVEQLSGIYAMRAEDMGLRFNTRSNLPSPCWVTGDPARFRQVLHNLLGNAAKFTEHGGITLTIAWDRAGGRLRAEVQDTGIGIPHDALERIFEPFQQVDSGGASTATVEGAGLGLAIARDIARAMDGDIHAQSEVGKGSTLIFSASLPAATPPAEAGRAQTANAAAPQPFAASAAPFRGCLVLLAEDNDINALVATNFLEIVGVDMERVKDGEEAVRLALNGPRRPDLVLMDCHMPKMDGYEATRTIRAQERLLGLSRVPIVALTATASDAERQDCLDAGMDDHLSKPCTLDDLRHAVTRWTATRVNAASELPLASSTSTMPPEQAATQGGRPACPDAPCRA